MLKGLAIEPPISFVQKFLFNCFGVFRWGVWSGDPLSFEESQREAASLKGELEKLQSLQKEQEEQSKKEKEQSEAANSEIVAEANSLKSELEAGEAGKCTNIAAYPSMLCAFVVFCLWSRRSHWNPVDLSTFCWPAVCPCGVQPRS